jgi:hypothetical protein
MGPRGGSLARIMPVRARPTIGGSLGLTTTTGSTVKPLARRSGETISSPLQIVGVSQALSVSRSSAVKEYSVIAFPEDDEDQASTRILRCSIRSVMSLGRR